MAYLFPIGHPLAARHLFDLGCRKDWEPPSKAVVNTIEFTGMVVDVTKEGISWVSSKGGSGLSPGHWEEIDLAA